MVVEMGPPMWIENDVQPPPIKNQGAGPSQRALKSCRSEREGGRLIIFIKNKLLTNIFNFKCN